MILELGGLKITKWLMGSVRFFHRVEALACGHRFPRMCASLRPQRTFDGRGLEVVESPGKMALTADVPVTSICWKRVNDLEHVFLDPLFSERAHRAR